MAAQSNIQHYPSQAAGISQPPPSVVSGVTSGPSVPLHVGQPGSVPPVNPLHTLDSRQQKPSTWDEVNLLQEALKPSIRSFSRITSRPPPTVPGSPWLSYASQLDILQRKSDRCWSADRRPGPPAKLAGLAAWGGGISRVGEAGFCITEEATKEFTHAELRDSKDCKKLPGSQDDHCQRAHDQFQSLLLAADARREKLEAQAADGSAQQDASENITETLDNIVARDPERYLAWLSTMGYFYFTMSDHNPYGYYWEMWCAWKAPISFAICYKQISAVWPTYGPGAIDRTKYGPPGDRPTITLEEAKRGNRRALEFRNTASGMEVYQKEKAQYAIIHGEATSREAAAHYHVLRGDDVWLFEPGESFQDEWKDPGRNSEAEMEASFGCWRPRDA